MALIAMAVHSTDENGRAPYTKEALYDIKSANDFNKHRLFIIDNGSSDEIRIFLKNFAVDFEFMFGEAPTIIHMEKNIGTAEAINLAWKERKEGEYCVKADDDFIVQSPNWIDELEQAMRIEPKIGILGLKRKDLEERPNHPEKHFASQLFMLEHKRGERWIVAENVIHTLGTCLMFSPQLLDDIGYLYQPTVYGHDDAIVCHRAHLAGYLTCFLPHIEIDHIDTGRNANGDKTEYIKWKEQHAAENMKQFELICAEYHQRTRSIYYNPFEK